MLIRIYSGCILTRFGIQNALKSVFEKTENQNDWTYDRQGLKLVYRHLSEAFGDSPMKPWFSSVSQPFTVIKYSVELHHHGFVWSDHDFVRLSNRKCTSLGLNFKKSCLKFLIVALHSEK